VDDTTLFGARVRGEIGAFAWHLISELPATWDEGKLLYVNEQGGRHKFFNVWPYVKQLRAWIAAQKRRKRAAPGEAMARFKFNRQEVLESLSAGLQV
jgi:hypothetical protein